MTQNDILILALITISLGRMAQAFFQHRELIRLLNDYATMTGELFPLIRAIAKGGDDDRDN